MSSAHAAKQGRLRQTAPATLDATDRRILELLRDDGRMSIATLAQRARLSRAGAYARLERLRDEGVIEGFAPRINAARIGLGITAIVLISDRQPSWRNLRERLSQMPEVEYCALITGEYDALIIVRVPEIQTLRDVILERLQSIADVRATLTTFVLDEVVRRPFVLPA